MQMYASMGIGARALEIGQQIENKLSERFAQIDRVSEYNQLKVLRAMQENRVSAEHFSATTGYG